MAYKMKGHTLPGINQKGNKGMEDGRANSSPFQQGKSNIKSTKTGMINTDTGETYDFETGKSTKSTADQMKNTKTKNRPEPTYPGTDEYRKEKDISKKRI